MNAMFFYRIGHWFYGKKIKIGYKTMDKINRLFFNSYIPSSCVLGKNTRFAYGGLSIAIHPRLKVGDNCVIGQNTTIGGKSGEKNVPVIGNNVYISAGVRIYGDVIIHHDSVIGGNSVVVKDVEPYSVMAGVPAKKIATITKKNIEKYKYYGIKNFKEEE